MSDQPLQQRLGFIGAGNMARSLIGGLLAKGYEASNILVSDPSNDCIQAAKAMGIKAAANNAELLATVDVLILAVKPQVMADVIKPLANALLAKKPLVISIAAGITCGALQKWSDSTVPVVRCMPNTPALLQEGATGLYASKAVSPEQKKAAQQILEAVGLALWVETEAQLDAVTALSGSGPAYFFLLMELMQQAGQNLGLDEVTAAKLTQQTALGAAKMAIEGDIDVAELRNRVTSPNGTTHAAVESFLHNGMAQMVSKALEAAYQRSQSLAEEIDP